MGIYVCVYVCILYICKCMFMSYMYIYICID